MKRLHRYLLSELAQNAALTVVAILAIFFMVALALVLGHSKAEGVPFFLILRHTGYKAVSTLFLTIPLTVLTACIFSYGRARAEGEFTAMRVAGIHPWQVIAPALLVGAICTFGLGWLQDEFMPAAHFKGRVSLEQDILANLETILKKQDRTIKDSEGGWSADWQGVQKDARNEIVLIGLQLLVWKRGSPDQITLSVRSDWAKPRLDTRSNVLAMEFGGNVQHEDSEGVLRRASRFSIDLNLGQFGTARKKKRESDRSYEELLSAAYRDAVLAARISDPKQKKKRSEDSRENTSEYHGRIAYAFSALLFAFLGSVLGLWKGTANRAVVFLVGFLIVIGIFYPLTMAGSVLATKGMLPPGLALWLGNIVIGSLASWIYWKVIRL